MIQINSKFPLEMPILDENGKQFKVSEVIHLPAVVFFYPKDMTPGCTQEACGFRDNLEEIKKFGYNVYGISSDGSFLHKRFKNLYKLNYPLFTDKNKEIQKYLGIVTEKKMFGKTFLGTVRSTFIVNSEGIIIATWGDDTSSNGKVDTTNHAKQVIEFINKTL